MVDIDDAYCVEWAYIPHFYNGFYVYQYATSIAASSLFAQKVASGEPGALERYLDLLRAGGSDYPYELVKTAGVDLATPAPYQALVGADELRSWTRSRRSSRSGNSARRERVTDSGDCSAARPHLPSVILAAHPGASSGRPLRAPGEKELEIGELERARGRHFRAYPEQAGADPPLAASPGVCHSELVGGKRVAVTLAQCLRVKALAPVLVVALGAGQVHLPVTVAVKRASALERRSGRPVDPGRQRQASRLQGDVRGEPEQVVGFPRQRRLLSAGARDNR